MKTILKLALATSVALAMASCGSKSEKSRNNGVTNPSMLALEEAPVAGELVAVGDDSVIVISLKAEPKPVTIKASDALDDLRLIKLEPSDEALVGVGKVWTNGRRLFIYDNKVVKQFDMDGKFLGAVGARGNGPGEYTIAPYDIYVDEEAGRICMLQYMSDKIMCYGIDGKFVEDIPLAHKANKGHLKVDFGKGIATISALVFQEQDNDDVIWTQDLQGNVLSSVARTDLKVPADFSNEIYGGMTAGNGAFTYSLMNIMAPADTLYSYSDGKLSPKFTVDFGGEVPNHEYLSFPDFYVVTSYGLPNPVSENTYILPTNSHFVVDKKSLRGAPADIMFDNLGTLTLGSGWAHLESPEYFAIAYDPGTLLDMLEASPTEHPLANEEGLKKMRELKETIDPDDNSYVLFGKWKNSQK
ncbi:MAG: 6-bladed beta-propeller [Clostridium sp.]|nr:6-bladed beta-propeller [Clostridium sp.]